MQCPLCNAKMIADVMLTGGCNGHFGEEDDRCYCDSADVHVEFECPNSAAWIIKEIRPGTWDYVRNKKPCKQQNVKVGELSDQESMARWFTENYVSGDKSNIF